ncbi:MAG: nitroreductase family protein [Theionarchaea archaeon]|nr:nitroreductase family protein [Theionarchaea archaeon]
MDFMEVVRNRRSIRRYKPDPVPEDALMEILEAGRLAPSGSNRQPWHFVVVKSKETRDAMGAPDWVADAPVVLVVCGDPEVSATWNVVDPTIAMEHMILAATNLGLGTCWIGRLGRDEQVKKVLDIPGHLKVIAITPIGYPDESPPPRDRKSLDQIVHNEKF